MSNKRIKKLANHFSKKSIFVTTLAVIIIIIGVLEILGDDSQSRGPVVPDPTLTIQSSEISHGDTSKKQVIFTFDGGSGLQSGEEILAVLARHKVKGTFFMTGRFVETYPDYVRKVVAAGHEIFNHTYDHPHLTTLTDQEIISELDEMYDTLRSVANVSAKPFFRPPYGDRDARVRQTAFGGGYQDVYWTIDAHDWMETEGVTATEVTDRIITNLAPGNIYLMHIGDNITGSILEDVFSTILNLGYDIVPLTEGL